MIEPLDLRTGINACIEAYKIKHKNKLPHYAFVNGSSYSELNTERLLVPDANDNSKRYLDHESSERIEVHLIKNLPEKTRNELEKIIRDMKVLIILSESQKPGKKDVFADLSSSTQELEKIFMKNSV